MPTSSSKFHARLVGTLYLTSWCGQLELLGENKLLDRTSYCNIPNQVKVAAD